MPYRGTLNTVTSSLTVRLVIDFRSAVFFVIFFFFIKYNVELFNEMPTKRKHVMRNDAMLH